MTNRVLQLLLLALLALGLTACVHGRCCNRVPRTATCRPAAAAPTKAHTFDGAVTRAAAVQDRCSRRVPQPVTCRPTAAAPTNSPTRDEEVERVTARTLARARAAEPETTELLKRLAAQTQGRLEGLEHRLKLPEATLSKYKRLMLKDPGTPPDEIEFYDALRYTIVIPEIEPGHHRRHVRSLFQRLEEEGHEVVVVKNYWPPGDTYSGVNATLRSPDDMLWELQCHTPGSYATKSSTHEEYERMRDPATPLEEKQRLFDEMTRAWDDVPVPEGMLEPKAVHPKEATRVLDRPAKAA